MIRCPICSFMVAQLCTAAANREHLALKRCTNRRTLSTAQNANPFTGRHPVVVAAAQLAAA